MFEHEINYRRDYSPQSPEDAIKTIENVLKSLKDDYESYYQRVKALNEQEPKPRYLKAEIIFEKLKGAIVSEYIKALEPSWEPINSLDEL